MKQVTVNGYEIKDTANRLGVHPESLRSWIKKFESSQSQEELSDKLRIKQLEKELKRVTQERDILKKAAAPQGHLSLRSGIYFASHTE